MEEAIYKVMHFRPCAKEVRRAAKAAPQENNLNKKQGKIASSYFLAKTHVDVSRLSFWIASFLSWVLRNSRIAYSL